MFKLKLTVILSAAVLLLSVSCKSAPDAKDEDVKKQQSAQRARDAANKAFMNETGDNIGDEDIPESLPSGAEAETVPEISFVYDNGVEDEGSVVSFDEPSVTFAPADTSSGEQPGWVKSPQVLFPQAQYLSAVGMGKNNVDAENSAIASIGKIIKQNVSSKVVTTDKDAVSSSGYSSSSSTLDEIIETYSVVDSLVGVKIHEFWWSDDGYVYALAYLNKSEAAQYYTRKISENETLINDNLIFADSNKGSFDAFAAVQKAVRAAEENDQYMDILNAVQPSAYRAKKLSYGSRTQVQEAAYGIAKTISIDVSVSGIDDTRIASALAQVLSDYGFHTMNTQLTSGAPYVIEASVEFMDVPSERNKYVRYIFNADLKEVSTGKILLPYSENKREGHTSASEAKQKAIRTLEQSILENYAQSFIEYLRNDL